jgi:DNA-binding PadR family transcriptional regulator
VVKRVSIFRKLAEGVRYLYALANSLNEHLSTVHDALKAFETNGLTQLVKVGPRGAKEYALSPLGRQALAVLDWVEAHGVVEPSELRKIFGGEVVEAMVDAGLLETRIEKVKVFRLMPDAPPGLGKEGSWIKCERCGEMIDVTGNPSYITCSCGQRYEHRGVDWASVALRGMLGALVFGVAGVLIGAAAGYMLHGEDKRQGAARGAVIGSIVGAIAGGIASAWRAYEGERSSATYLPMGQAERGASMTLELVPVGKSSNSSSQRPVTTVALELVPCCPGS